MEPALVVTDVKKRYASGTEALKGVSLTVPAGDFFALLGPNGAGKTTIIGIVTGLVNKTGGDVKVFGYDIDGQPEEAKAQIGLVGQEINFNPFEKPIDIIINQGGYYGIPRAIAVPRAKQLLQDLGLADKAEGRAMELSGGMKRRLMIARALIHQPRFLILDTTHYLEEAEQLAKHVAIINKGQILVNDTIENVLAMHTAGGEANEGYKGGRLEEVFLNLIQENK